MDRADLIRSCLPLARRIARVRFASLPIDGYDRDDFESEATLALIRAADSYNPLLGKFPVHAAVCIRHHFRKLNDAANNGTRHAGPHAELKDVADHRPGDPAEEAEHRETLARLGNYVAALPPGQRDALNCRLAGMNQESIALRLGITQQAVQFRQRRAVETLSYRFAG